LFFLAFLPFLEVAVLGFLVDLGLLLSLPRPTAG